MSIIVNNSKYYLDDEGRLEVYDYKLARKLNRYTKKYGNGKYLCQPGEEMVFKFPPNQIPLILSLFLSKTQTQTPEGI